MNGSSNLYLTQNRNINTQLFDRLLSIYSLLLILIGTPCNLLCCVIYFQKSNRLNSIKTIFGYLAFLDTIVLYTFNLNYVVREFHSDTNIAYFKLNNSNINNSNSNTDELTGINAAIIKKNLEEHSLIVCRFLSYLAFSTLQTSSWILAFGSFNRYLLIKNFSRFDFLCKRLYTIVICLVLTCIFFLSNTHILWMNGYRSKTENIICYKNVRYQNYMVWYQRFHLILYCVLPSFILFIFNSLLMRIIFASKKRLDNHKRLVLFAATATTTIPATRRKSFLALQQISSTAIKFKDKNNPKNVLNRQSRKLTISLIFITISYFTLTFPSTVIFSFFRPYIEPSSLRRTLSHLFTNLSTTTHVIRLFIYFFCSTDFRNDLYRLILSKRLYHKQSAKIGRRRRRQHRQQQNYQLTTYSQTERKIETTIISTRKDLGLL